MGVTIWDLRFGSYDLGFTIWDLRFGSYDLGFTVWDFGFTILDLRDQKSVAHSMAFNRKSKIVNPKLPSLFLWLITQGFY